MSLDALADRAEYKAQDIRTAQLRGGLGLARGLMWLIALVVLLIALFAWATYPGKGAAADVRSEWFSEIKDLIQLMVVSLLVPTLATLMGYIFGREPNNDHG